MQHKRLTVAILLASVTFIAIALALLKQLAKSDSGISGTPWSALAVIAIFSLSGGACGTVVAGLAGKNPWHGMCVGAMGVNMVFFTLGLVSAVAIVFGIAFD